MARAQKDPWCLGIPVTSPSENLSHNPIQPVPKGKKMGHAFGLNHRYVYEEVPGRLSLMVYLYLCLPARKKQYSCSTYTGI